MKRLGDERVVVTMSLEMLKDLKKEIGKFGFEPRQYEEFLRSVWAMKGDTVVTFSNHEISKYREKFTQKFEHGLNDALIFDEIAKVRTQDERKVWSETGDFCPRYFWDYVLKKRY